jgi:hypothetical protein
MKIYQKIILTIIVIGLIIFGILYTRNNSLETRINRSILNWYFDNISLTENAVSEYKTETEKEAMIKWYKVIKELNDDWDFIEEDIQLKNIDDFARMIDHTSFFENQKTNEYKILTDRYYFETNTFEPIPLVQNEMICTNLSNCITSSTKTLWEGDFDSICISPENNNLE